jgi:hypothetical protein
MKKHNTYRIVACSIAMSVSAFGQTTIYPANDGFEVPNLGSNASGTSKPAADSKAGWTFVGQSGITFNGGPFQFWGSFENGNNDGTSSRAGQAAFIRGGDGTTAGPSAAYIFQSFDLPSAVSSLSVSLLIQNRQGGGQPLKVFVGNATEMIDLGMVTPAVNGALERVITGASKPLAAGTYTLYIVGTRSSDGFGADAIDSVRVVVAPAKK